MPDGRRAMPLAGLGTALAVNPGAPAGELRHVLVVLGGPRAGLGSVQLTLDPLFGERVQAAVSGDDRGFEPRAERALAHGFLLVDAEPNDTRSRLKSSRGRGARRVERA